MSKPEPEEETTKQIIHASFGTAEHSLLAELNYNAGTFAAFKTHQQAKEMVRLLKDKKGKTIQKEGMKIKLSTQGIKKATWQTHSQKYYQLLALYDIEKLLKNAKRHAKRTPDTGKHKGIKQWHYFEIDVKGVPSLINVLETNDGQFVFYTLNQKNKPH